MKEMVRYGLVLSLICAIAAGLLAGVDLLTKPRIIAQAQSEERAVLKEILPDAEDFKEIKAPEDIIYYKVYDKGGKFLGVAFKAQAKGYSSTIETMAAMDKDGRIIAIRVVSQNETPGLGTRVTEDSFGEQFAKKSVTELDQVDAISGATISSTAVIDSVKKTALQIQGLLKDER